MQIWDYTHEKTPSYRYKGLHDKHNMVWRPSQVYSGNLYNNKMVSFQWIQTLYWSFHLQFLCKIYVLTTLSFKIPLLGVHRLGLPTSYHSVIKSICQRILKRPRSYYTDSEQSRNSDILNRHIWADPHANTNVPLLSASNLAAYVCVVLGNTQMIDATMELWPISSRKQLMILALDFII